MSLRFLQMLMQVEMAGPVIQTTIKVVRYVVRFLQMLIHHTQIIIFFVTRVIKKAAIVALEKISTYLQTLTHMVLVGNVTMAMSETRIGVLGKAQFLQTLTHQVMVGNVIMVIANMAIVV